MQARQAYEDVGGTRRQIEGRRGGIPVEMLGGHEEDPESQHRLEKHLGGVGCVDAARDPYRCRLPHQQVSRVEGSATVEEFFFSSISLGA